MYTNSLLVSKSTNIINNINIQSISLNDLNDTCDQESLKDKEIYKSTDRSMESQYEKQFERIEKIEVKRSLKKFNNVEENACNQSKPTNELSGILKKKKPIDNDVSDDEDTIKSSLSDCQSIKTEDFSTVFNKYIIYANKKNDDNDQPKYINKMKKF